MKLTPGRKPNETPEMYRRRREAENLMVERHFYYAPRREQQEVNGVPQPIRLRTGPKVNRKRRKELNR